MLYTISRGYSLNLQCRKCIRIKPVLINAIICITVTGVGEDIVWQLNQFMSFIYLREG
jgi:hypothetical protein